MPSGVETKTQHVLLQLTRLPTTVDQTKLTGAFEVNPDAVRATLVLTGPLVLVSDAVTLLVSGKTGGLQGRSRADGRGDIHRPVDRSRRRPVVLGDGEGDVEPLVYGIGDWGTLRYR